MIKRLLLFTILITAAVSVSAETAVWSVLPEYSSITRLSDDLFIVEKGARSAIIDASGKEVIPMTLDSITPMVDGKSLLLTRDGNDFRLRSIIFENQRIVNVDGEYFVGDYPSSPKACSLSTTRRATMVTSTMKVDSRLSSNTATSIHFPKDLHR